MKEIAIAVIGLVVGAIVGPYINWGIEKRKQKLAYRRELVAKWRAMLAEAATDELQRDDTKLVAILERHQDFYSLTNLVDSDYYQEYRTRHASVGVPVFHRYLADEISRIEREWDLV